MRSSSHPVVGHPVRMGGAAGVDRSRRLRLAQVWALRLAWVALGALGAGALGGALDGRSGAVALVMTVGSTAAWALVLLAALVPSVVALTAARTLVPITVVVAIVIAASGASPASGAAVVTLTVVATLLVLSPEVGDHFVQSSAYGHERRLLLRPPVAYLVPVAGSWCVLCAATVAGPLLLAARSWLAGVPVTALALAAGVALWPRFHRLSRRWLVLVPAGVVVHDDLVLAETAMFPRADLLDLHLAPAGSEAADLTGPAAGHVIEIELRELATVTLAATRSAPRGTAIHLRSMLVAPTRPGRALADAGEQRLPVG